MQREMPFFMSLEKAQWVPDDIVSGWANYREAVVWCWRSRRYRGLNEPNDQALCAREIGVYVPHFCRYVKERSKAPMDLNPNKIPAFEAYTGWWGVTQWLNRQAQLTVMEEVIARKSA